MIEFIIGIGLGMILIWITSKYYCFKKREEWNKFKIKWLQQQ